jgi:hypothetical protein
MPPGRVQPPGEDIMTAIYTAGIFSTVDGFGAPKPGTWGGVEKAILATTTR